MTTNSSTARPAPVARYLCDTDQLYILVSKQYHYYYYFAAIMQDNLR